MSGGVDLDFRSVSIQFRRIVHFNPFREREPGKCPKYAHGRSPLQIGRSQGTGKSSGEYGIFPIRAKMPKHLVCKRTVVKTLQYSLLLLRGI